MAGSNSLNPLNVANRRSKYSELPKRKTIRTRETDEEKQDHTDYSDDTSDYSSDSSSSVPSRDTSGSYGSQRPMLRTSPKKPHANSQRLSAYKVPNKIVRNLCRALIAAVILFIIVLIRLSVVSSRKVEKGDLGVRPPPPPPQWESFEFLSRYYGGIRTLVLAADNKPEYPTLEDERALPNETLSDEVPTLTNRAVPASKPFLAYQNQTSAPYLAEYSPIQECFLDAASSIRIPKLQYYEGRPNGFPQNAMGSYELLDLPEDICFERYGRLGPYGYGYSLRNGGLGIGRSGEMEGSEAVWAQGSTINQVNYDKVDWAAAQIRCHHANAARFQPKTSVTEPPITFSILDDGLKKRDIVESGNEATSNITEETTTAVQSIEDTNLVNKFKSEKKLLPRQAVVIRTWDDYNYQEESILMLRAMITELSLGSGGEFDVHLLIQVRDEAKNPIWADSDTYQKHLAESVPEEFRGIATFWSQTQMLMLYQGIHDIYARGPELPVHGVYRGLQMAMQHFAQIHPEYDYFWHWEMDARYTGHYYDLFTKIDSWTTIQPRKGLWERSSRFYVPAVHGSWEDFKQMVRVQSEMGTENPNDIWSPLKGAKEPTVPKNDKPIWGPERPIEKEDWFEIENDPIPPTDYAKDKYVWGVGEKADLITLNPMFDPEGTTWLLANDITGYNTTAGLPPRRAAIITAGRMSKRLLNTMHRETVFKKHHAFSEMWAPTAALQHGYKAVYFPHPIFVDREWPTEYLAAVVNAGRNGATGAARTSVFGDREHNLAGTTWYYNTGFAPNLWKRWLGLKVNNEGGEEFETTVNEGRSGKGVNNMKGGEGRMCLPPMLLHPAKDIDLPVEEIPKDDKVPISDPGA